MPLLDKLKTDPTDVQPIGLSLAEEWISLSAAIGVEVSQQQLPQASSSRLDASSSVGEDMASDEDDSYWMSLLAIVSEDLLDVLVRAYFTISHLLWPILHAPTFMTRYASTACRRDPSFVALVMSICSLSSRYAQDTRISLLHENGESVSQRLISLSRTTITKLASERTNLELFQAMFNLSVVQEGTSRPNMLWTYLSQALSMAIDLGLHRRVDDYSSFSAVDIEVRKRTMWALYSQDVKASCTYGRPPLLRLTDLDLDDPSAVDDVYISVEQGIGIQPPDRPSVMAGFVAAVRLHMVLERTIRRINRGQTEDTDGSSQSFRSLLLPYRRIYRIEDELDMLSKATDDIPGDWNFTPETVADPDSVRFFQKTRVFTLQQFIRLLVARHRFSELLASRSEGSDTAHDIIQQIIQYALGIIGTYCVIDAKGRLGFFGAHAIAQLTQAGAGLIGILLHLRTIKESLAFDERGWHLCMQGLPAAIQVLRQLGKRRPAGLRSAELLAEFTRACRIPVFTGSDSSVALGTVVEEMASPVEIPMLRSLPRRALSESKVAGSGFDFGADMEEWLRLALSEPSDLWGTRS